MIHGFLSDTFNVGKQGRLYCLKTCFRRKKVLLPFLLNLLGRRPCTGILLTLSFLLTALTDLRAETVTVHANRVWEMTDVVVQENMTLTWEVDKSSLWCFNPRILPGRHTAEGIPVEALKGYVYPGQSIGRLIGRIGDSGRMFAMGTSGSLRILPSEDGEFLYLTMNDDILGLYGKGFKDNEGVLIVKVTQSREAKVSSGKGLP